MSTQRIQLGDNIAAVIPCSAESRLELPIFSSKVSAGFPSPGDDHLEQALDLNQHLINHPSSTFFMRVSGNSMIDAGIHDGDIIIVDRSLDAQQGKVVVAVVDGQLTVKRLERGDNAWLLKAENPVYPSINPDDAQDIQIWGVVTHVIHNL